ncbi:MAG TPA: hypothetical protein DIC52_00180 [Candidatus Latescibacteria bacterium]|nr:hypothetical protein [Candidatus Latescibacterota bacterium]
MTFGSVQGILLARGPGGVQIALVSLLRLVRAPVCQQRTGHCEAGTGHQRRAKVTGLPTLLGIRRSL